MGIDDVELKSRWVISFSKKSHWVQSPEFKSLFSGERSRRISMFHSKWIIDSFSPYKMNFDSYWVKRADFSLNSKIRSKTGFWMNTFLTVFTNNSMIHTHSVCIPYSQNEFIFEHIFVSELFEWICCWCAVRTVESFPLWLCICDAYTCICWYCYCE